MINIRPISDLRNEYPKIDVFSKVRRKLDGKL